VNTKDGGEEGKVMEPEPAIGGSQQTTRRILEIRGGKDQKTQKKKKNGPENGVGALIHGGRGNDKTDKRKWIKKGEGNHK